MDDFFVMSAVGLKNDFISICKILDQEVGVSLLHLDRLIEWGFLVRNKNTYEATAEGLVFVQKRTDEMRRESEDFMNERGGDKISITELFTPRKKNFLRAMSRPLYNASASSQTAGDSPVNH